MERYNPQENRWHTIAPMGTRRKHLGCAVYQDMIYAVGGRDDTTELSSAERYNPRTNQWSPVVAMTSRRSGVSAAPSLCPSVFSTFCSALGREALAGSLHGLVRQNKPFPAPGN